MFYILIVIKLNIYLAILNITVQKWWAHCEQPTLFNPIFIKLGLVKSVIFATVSKITFSLELMKANEIKTETFDGSFVNSSLY